MFSGDGFSEESFGVNDHVEADDHAFQAFLARVRAPRVWLLEIDALSLAVSDALSAGFGESAFGESGFSDDSPGFTGGVHTLRYSTHGWTRRSYGVAEYLLCTGNGGNYASTPNSVNLNPAQNWLTYSGDFSNAAWTKAGGAVSDGVFTENAAAATQHRLHENVTLTSGDTFTVAAIVSRVSGSRQAQLGVGGTGAWIRVYFDLDAVTVANAVSGSGTITDLGGGEFLITATGVCDLTGANTAYFAMADGTATGSETYNGDGVSAVLWQDVRFQRSPFVLPYIETESAANKGNLEFIVDMTADNWVPAAENGIFGKDDGSDRSYGFRILAGGYLNLYGGFNSGSVDFNESATTTTGLAAGERARIKVKRNATSGDIEFWKSVAGGAWSQIGSTVTGVAGPIHVGAAPLHLGDRIGGAVVLAGKIYSAEMRNDIDGEVVADCNPARDARPGDTSFTSSTTGEVYTIHQSGADPARLVAGEEVGLFYDGRIKDGFTVSRSIAARDGIGGLARVFAELSLSNTDGALDGLTSDYALDGRAVRLKVGAIDADYSEFGTVFAGVVESAAISQSAVRLRFSDGMARLALPMQSSKYLGTGGLEGGADLKGKPKPLCYGKAYNVTPVLVDAANLVWQVHDGAIQDVPAVRDRGVALTKVSGAPAPGEYQVDTDDATITLGALPDGELTCDVEGDTPAAGYSDQVAVIAQRILADKLYTSEIDTTAFANLNTRISAPSGVWVGAEERTAAEVLEELLFGAGCFGGFSRHGVFTVGQLSVPTADAPMLELDETSITAIEREPLPAALDPAAWALTVGWRRNHTVQTDIAALAADADREFAAEAWRYERVEDAAVQSRHLLAREYGPVASPFNEAADAEAEAERLFTLWGAERAPFRVNTHIEGMLADVGRVVQLTHPRHRLQFGRPARVVGQTITGARVELRVIA